MTRGDQYGEGIDPVRAACLACVKTCQGARIVCPTEVSGGCQYGAGLLTCDCQ